MRTSTLRVGYDLVALQLTGLAWCHRSLPWHSGGSGRASAFWGQEERLSYAGPSGSTAVALPSARANATYSVASHTLVWRCRPPVPTPLPLV